MPRNIIIDTDPGIDDAAAIAVALRHPELNVKLICSVGANVEVEKTTLNALRLVEFFDVDVPVARGCGEPLLHKLETCPEVHGISGMDGYDFPEVKREVLPMHAVEAMRKTIMESEEKTTLVVIGTHTNVAILLRMYPEVKEKIEEIVTMGGAIGGGNVTSTAEFNIYNDPHAAKIVFNSGIPLTMIGLNVTNRALISQSQVKTLHEGGRVANMIASLFMHYRCNSVNAGLRMHDGCAIAYLIKPELFKTEMKYVEIVTDGPAAGATVIDCRTYVESKGAPNVNVCMDIDSEQFAEWFMAELCK